MTVAIIAAVSDNGVIGRDGNLPWHLPDDIKRFRSLTIGHAVVMGRRTFESIGAPLEHRANFVLSRKRDYVASWARVVSTISAALTIAERMGDVFVVGGADVYAAALPFCTRAYVTRVHATVEGGYLTRFPCDLTSWRVVASEHREADARHSHALTFETLSRR
jgi:dihydrofolate reductase